MTEEEFVNKALPVLDGMLADCGYHPQRLTLAEILGLFYRLHQVLEEGR